MKLLRTIMSTILLLLLAAFGNQAIAASDSLSDAEKIKRIMSVAEKAKEPRNFYRWQSETSGNNLLAAGEYNEKLFNYFMGMTVDAAHFAGGRGVYYAEDLTSSSQFIRGEGKGSLIEVRIPKGMPTIDLTNQQTVRKLEKLGIKPSDVLSLDPPLAVRYSSSGWWAVKRREGVKFQPFNPAKFSTEHLVSAFTAIEDNPRAAEVLAPHISKRVETEVRKNAAILVSQPKLQRFVSKETLTSAITKSPELRQFYKDKFQAGLYSELPANHFASIISAVRSSGLEIDESAVFTRLNLQQKLGYLDDVYPDFTASEAVVKSLLGDEAVKGSPFKLSAEDLKKVERHIQAALERRPELLTEFPRAYHLLSSEVLVSLVKNSDQLKKHFTEILEAKTLDLPMTREVGPVLADLRAAGVEYDDTSIFKKIELPQRIQFLNHFYADRATPTEMVDSLLGKDSLWWVNNSPYQTGKLSKVVSRIAMYDPDLLNRNPHAFQFLDQATLSKAVAGSAAARTKLQMSLVAGKFAGIAEKSLGQLVTAMEAAGQPVSEEVLFKNLDLAAKLQFLDKRFSKPGIQVPAKFIDELLEDNSISGNGLINDALLEKIGLYVNNGLFDHKDDLKLLEKASRLYSFNKLNVDGRPLIGFEHRSKEAQAALGSYASAYLRQLRMYDRDKKEAKVKVLNSLVAGRFRHWDYSLYQRLADSWDRDSTLTAENQLILEEEIVKDLINPNARDSVKLNSWARLFVKNPSEATATSLFKACNDGVVPIGTCRGHNTDRLSLYEKSAVKVLETSPENYIAAFKNCLSNRGCWSLRSIYQAAPPRDLSLKQVKELMAAYKAAPTSGRVDLNNHMIEIAAKHWREFPEEFESLFEPFANGLYSSVTRTDEMRVRRATALREVGDELAETLKPSQTRFARLLGIAYTMDIAHERDSGKADYPHIFKLEKTSKKLRELVYELEKSASTPITAVTAKEPTSALPEAAAPKLAPDSSAPPSSAAPKNTCASLFQKLGQFLKRSRR